MNHGDKVLVIGAGIAGMDASLHLAKAGKQVYLVEKLPIIGGTVIKNEESFPNLECSTCMVAPIQQDVLQDPRIETMTLSSVEKIEGEVGDFSVTILKKARYVSMTDCIGCGMCYEPCPVTLSNSWEENLGEKKAIYVPTAGSLPNVPAIETEHCLKLNGEKECNACVEACMFGAINLEEKDETITVQVGAVLVATGAELYDVTQLANLGYGKYPGVYTSMEFERLFASNGPTQGELTLRNSSKKPKAVAMIHCVGREERGYCSAVCCMYSLKYAHFLRHKLNGVTLYNLHTDICVPDKSHQKFLENIKKETQLVPHSSMKDLTVVEKGEGLTVSYLSLEGQSKSLDVDMVILAPAMVPGQDTLRLGEITGVELDDLGFLSTGGNGLNSIQTTREGIFLPGCVEGPKDIQSTVTQAESAVGGMLSVLSS